jgi:hypothetical protein
MLRLLGKRETNPQLAKNAKTDVSCPHQPPHWGAEREEFAPEQLEQEFEDKRDTAQSQNEDEGKIDEP